MQVNGLPLLGGAECAAGDAAEMLEVPGSRDEVHLEPMQVLLKCGQTKSYRTKVRYLAQRDRRQTRKNTGKKPGHCCL